MPGDADTALTVCTFFCRLCLVARQADLADRRAVAEADALDFAAQLDIRFIETSAKHAVNVQEAFLAMARDIARRMVNAPAGATGGPSINIAPKRARKKVECC